MSFAKQPWIYSARLDGAFILAPALAIAALVLLFQTQIARLDGVPPWAWAALIVGVDVGHVYSTLFRTYADPEEFKARRSLYVLAPLVCWVVGAMLYSLGAQWFWRALAYLAVFHFVRQQYGFMMIYGRKEKKDEIARRLDRAVVYAATLYPLLYWHTHLPRNFNWFVDGDFAALRLPLLGQLGAAVYVALLVAYVLKEARVYWSEKIFNLPKNLLLAGTVVSWLTGVVYMNSDLAFTATNVVAHGVPYIALIWIYGHNRGETAPATRILGKVTFRSLFSPRMVPVYLALLVALGYCEEGLWDGLVWTEHKGLFHLFRVLPAVDDKALLSWLAPLLALPQMTHYVLDAYIWRLHEPNTQWKQILFHGVAQS
jgi:hypothetical protein